MGFLIEVYILFCWILPIKLNIIAFVSIMRGLWFAITGKLQWHSYLVLFIPITILFIELAAVFIGSIDGPIFAVITAIEVIILDFVVFVICIDVDLDISKSILVMDKSLWGVS